MSTIFPTAFVHFLSLCHILVILAIFQAFSLLLLLLYLLWSSVISVPGQSRRAQAHSLVTINLVAD